MKIKFLQTRSPLHRVNCANPLKPLAQFLAASLGVSFNTIKTSEIDSGDDNVCGSAPRKLGPGWYAMRGQPNTSVQ